MPQVLGGALAAATSALAASFLGIAGTLVGAVVGSVVATIGAAVYSHSLRKAATQLRVIRPPNRADGARASQDQDSPEAEPVAGGGHDQIEVLAGLPPRPVPGRRRWLRLTVGMGLGVVLALAGITAAELIIGHPVSGSTKSGTSIGQAVGGASRQGSLGTVASPTSPPKAGPATPTATTSSPATVTGSATSRPAGTATAPATRDGLSSTANSATGSASASTPAP
ncbi:MAG: hypothetical protein WCG47_21550 [Dermatophilaceae bacterium]